MRKLITRAVKWPLLVALLLQTFWLAGQACPAGSLGGNVFKDFNFNGLNDEITVGIASVKVTVFGPNSVPAGMAMTDASGNWSVLGLTNSVKYRVEFALPASLVGFQPTFFGGMNGTTIQFPTTPDCTVDAAFSSPEDFCSSEPFLATPCYVNGAPQGGGDAALQQALIGFPYSATGQGQTFNTKIDSVGSIGACWGLAYSRVEKKLFSAAVLRRHSGFGPGGVGAIYVEDVSNINAPMKTATIDLPSLGIPVGANPRAIEMLPPNIINPSYDSTAFPLVGKMGIGDIDISEDGKNLWVVNLFDRTLYRIFVNNPFQMPTAANVTAYPMTNPGCGANSDWRPWAVKVHQGEVYVGMVCTSEMGQTQADLHAFVKKLNVGGTFDPVFDFSLDYARGSVFFSQPTLNKWRPWTNSWATITATGNGIYPQPLLSNIGFDIDGSMILGFLDRSAIQGGYLNYGPSTAFSSPTTTFSGGDLVRICKNSAGVFALEGGVGCTNAGGAANGKGPGGSEYYWDETWENSFANPFGPFIVHDETALGAMTLVPGKGEVVIAAFDPLDYNTGGILWLNNTTGKAVNGYEIFPDAIGFAGKSAGLGDVLTLCPPAPIQKGNFVWNDRNKDGIQDPNEKPIAGVNVSLFGTDCDLIATTQTNTAGEYYFTDQGSGDTLAPNASYYIVVGGGGQFSDGVLLDSLVLTLPNIGFGLNANSNDSDGEIAGAGICFTGLPFVALMTGGAGSVDHTCDFGFYLGCLLDFDVVSSEDESCVGLNDGSITVTATGAPSIEYSFDGGPFALQNSWTDLAPGSYEIIVRDPSVDDCMIDTTITIGPGAPLPMPNILGEPFPCPNSNSIYTTSATVGSSWIWILTGGGTISANQNSATVTWGNVSGGPFYVIVEETNAAGCKKKDSLEITIRPLTLSCQSNINLSLDQMCMAQITPGMVLSGQYPTLLGYTVTVKDIAGNVVPNAKITGKGDFTFKVTEPCAGNSCWGNLKTEDKLGPKLICTDQNVPCSATNFTPIIPNLNSMPTLVVIGGFGGVTITDNCAIISIQYADDFENFDCTQSPTNLSARIKRTWTATDMSGNHSTCIQNINLVRKTTTDVDFPADLDLFDCRKVSDLPPFVTGAPTIGGFSIWPNSSFCELNAAYEDQVFPLCHNAFKIIRTWTVYDWCRPTQAGVNPRIHKQIIKSLDVAGPTFACPDDFLISTMPSVCEMNVNLPDVEINDNCSGVRSIKAVWTNPETWLSVELAGVLKKVPQNGNPWDVKLVAEMPFLAHLPLGDHQIKYIAEDSCGNISNCIFTVSVVDQSAPQVICQELTQVALGQDGIARVDPKSFDDGSYDNCAGQVWFKVKRMDASVCLPASQNLFDDEAKFCCSDRGDTITVILRVYDIKPPVGKISDSSLEGHYAECMVDVLVEDKMKPLCQAPENKTVECEVFDPTLWSYGQAEAFDNCKVKTITESINNSLFDAACKSGRITRTWTVTDESGNTSRCTQSIVVVHRTDFFVKFPDDVNITTCDGTGNYGQPTFTGKNCELLTTSFEDHVYTVVPDACFKIIRTWKISNWCDFSPNWVPQLILNNVNSSVGATAHGDSDNHGYFLYHQIIKINDQEDPILVCPTGTVYYDDDTKNDSTLFSLHGHYDLCEGPAPLTISASDKCSGTAVTFRYILKLDLDNDGFMETIWSSNEPNRPAISVQLDSSKATARIVGLNLPYGKHLVKWVVEDGCGNESACEYNFIIRDTKKPTVVCLAGLSANIMQTGMIQVWANDFVLYAEDNCTPSKDLKIAIRKMGTGTGFPTDTSVTFTCAELNTQVVEVWAEDAAGNADYCLAYLLVQDHVGTCPAPGASGSIAGAIQDRQTIGVEEVKVKISGSQPGLPSPEMFTGANGVYSLAGLPFGNSFEIKPEKDLNPTNGVSTFDLVLISKHILGSEPFNSPEKWIAGDINHSNHVSTADIVELRKVILGILPDFPSNTSWRFFQKGFQFDMTSNPLASPFPENITVGQFLASESARDFRAVKVGDVNGSAQANGLVEVSDRSPSGLLIFETVEKTFKKGEIVELPVSSKNMAQVLGWQFTFGFEPSILEFQNIEIGSLTGLSSDCFGLQNSREGLVTTSWIAPAPDFLLPTSDAFFTLRFVAKSDGKLSTSVHLSSQITAAEGYAADGSDLDLALRFGEKAATSSDSVFEVWQNEPNPFSDKTRIRFALPEAADVTLKVIDATGRIVFSQQKGFEKGVSTIELTEKELSASGVYFYEISTERGAATRKMILRR